MSSPTLELELLANRVTHGDAGAAVEFRQKLEPQMEILVGQTLRSGIAHSSIARFVLKRCHHVPVPQEGRPEEKRSRYIRTLAEDVCDHILKRLRDTNPQQTMRLQDTLALCG